MSISQTGKVLKDIGKRDGGRVPNSSRASSKRHAGAKCSLKKETREMRKRKLQTSKKEKKGGEKRATRTPND